MKNLNKFLEMVTKLQIEKATMYVLFFSFIQFLAIEIIKSVFYHAKLITINRKKAGVPVLVGELEPSFNSQSSISRRIHQVLRVRVYERELITP